MNTFHMLSMATSCLLVAVANGDKDIDKGVASKSAVVPQFAMLDAKAALSAADAIVANYEAVERDLTSQLDDQKAPADRKVVIVYALRRIRSAWAVPSLVKIIEFAAPFRDGTADHLGRWGANPAAEALYSIGQPAVVRIVNVLGTEKNERRLQLMLTVIHSVEGGKPGRAWIECALSTEKDETAKQNISNALKKYDVLSVQWEKGS